jgi:hypothetical protein
VTRRPACPRGAGRELGLQVAREDRDVAALDGGDVQLEQVGDDAPLPVLVGRHARVLDDEQPQQVAQHVVDESGLERDREVVRVPAERRVEVDGVHRVDEVADQRGPHRAQRSPVLGRPVVLAGQAAERGERSVGSAKSRSNVVRELERRVARLLEGELADRAGLRRRPAPCSDASVRPLASRSAAASFPRRSRRATSCAATRSRAPADCVSSASGIAPASVKSSMSCTAYATSSAQSITCASTLRR